MPYVALVGRMCRWTYRKLICVTNHTRGSVLQIPDAIQLFGLFRIGQELGTRGRCCFNVSDNLQDSCLGFWRGCLAIGSIRDGLQELFLFL